MYIWNLQTKEIVQKLQGHTGELEDVCSHVPACAPGRLPGHQSVVLCRLLLWCCLALWWPGRRHWSVSGRQGALSQLPSGQGQAQLEPLFVAVFLAPVLKVRAGSVASGVDVARAFVPRQD